MDTKEDIRSENDPPAYPHSDDTPPGVSEHQEEADARPPPYKPPTFTTDGLNITFLNSEVAVPQYRLTRNIFEGRPGPTVGVERLLYAQPALGGDIERVDVKQLYDISSNTATGRQAQIEGPAGKSSYCELYMAQEPNGINHSFAAHGPWKVFEKNHQHHVLEARPGSRLATLKALRQRGDPSRQIQWFDDKGEPIAIEHRAVFSKEKTLQTQPTLELMKQLEEKDVGLLLAVWIARMRQEAIYLHWGHLTLQESKLSSQRPVSL